MFEWLTPQLLVAFIVLYFLFVWGIALGVRDLKHSLRNKKRDKVFEIGFGRFITLASLLREIEPPLAFEIAVHHLGKEVHFYLTVPGSRESEIAGRFPEARLAQNYNVYHPNGSHKGFVLKPQKENPILDFRTLDFSKVNEIGEAAVFQTVARKDKKGCKFVNLRVFASAPTTYQADEILTALAPGFLDFKLSEARNKDFWEFLNRRAYLEKDEFLWGSS